MSILQDYQVKFLKKNFFNKDFKQIYTSNSLLSAYISDHNDVMQVDLLLVEINAVLNGIKPWGGWDTKSLYFARITSAETKMYEDVDAWQTNNNISPNCIIPTASFKEIVIAWRAFLVG